MKKRALVFLPYYGRYETDQSPYFVEVVDGLRESLLVDAEARRELVHGFEPVVGVEQRGEYGDNQHEVDRVEQGVEYGVEKVGYGIARNRAGETEQPHIGSEHCSRGLGWVYTMQRYEKSCANASALTFCCAAAAAAPPKREKGPENGGPQLAVPAVCDAGRQPAQLPVAASLRVVQQSAQLSVPAVCDAG